MFNDCAAGALSRQDVLDYLTRSCWVRDPRGNVVKKYKITADSYGGIANTFELPADAMLGAYHVNQHRQHP